MSNLGALQLIMDYSDTEDETEVSQDVSEKKNVFDTKAENGNCASLDRQRLPLPAELKDLYTCNTSNILQHNNSDFHDGKVRSFPHERGNWATFVYIVDDVNKNIDFSNYLIERTKIVGEFKRTEDFHISLSRTVILRHHWIDLFVDSLKNKLKHIRRFRISFGPLEVYCNDEKTRTFIGISVLGGYDKLLECVEMINFSLLEFKLSTFYKEASFHVSLVWCLGDKTEYLKDLLQSMQTEFENIRSSNIDSSSLLATNVICKTGNRIYSIPLK